ncbi:MAG: molybdopterin containing oxidoreductase [Cryomorphaceae bacterium]|nr:MAG: molybdopterin containing oxidoreductase [Cryomorphaceae bacterium]
MKRGKQPNRDHTQESKTSVATGNEVFVASRRRFITQSALVALGTVVGSPIVYGRLLPEGLIPVVLNPEVGKDILEGKHPDMIVRNKRPWNIETPVHLLDDVVTPADKMYVRNNGNLPENPDASSWELTIDGEAVQRLKTYSLAELKNKFKHYTYQTVLECGGNTRAEYTPGTKGIQWGYGAVSCARWTGVRLKDVLSDVGIAPNAVYIGYYGKDTHVSGDLNKVVISRGVPIEKAMEDETLLAFQMNGKDIPLAHGHPLRLIVGGFPASASGKWVHRLVVRDRIHDGAKMKPPTYCVPCNPVTPGDSVQDEDMCIIQNMPVKSIITYPKTGAMVKPGQQFEVRGHAWAGDRSIREMHISVDFGATWQVCNLQAAPNRNAWQQFSAQVNLEELGYYEIWARATDDQGVSQPMVQPGWNPRGYINNATHRIAVKVS